MGSFREEFTREIPATPLVCHSEPSLEGEESLKESLVANRDSSGRFAPLRMTMR
ncbi:hypothetical protein [Helicobacter marmotae]|uniref:hypothetical protein n=1 Tax=Helicobacter marmotae TaxID=152490 RepID=UPI0013155740|nr:hypothetical protein [Helicobacter marmotae]